MIDHALIGMDAILHGAMTPVVMGVLAGITRISLRGWHGFGDWLGTTFTGIVAGLIAHWIMAQGDYDPTVKAIVEIMAALFGRDIMDFLFSRKTLDSLASAGRKRLVHEILNRGRAKD